MSYTAVMHIYNEEKHIYQVIMNIYRQSKPPDRLFIVDNGSTDNTDDILHLYEVEHIHYLHDEKAPAYERRAYAFNKAVSHVQTPYLLKVDGDILIQPNYAELLLPYIQEPHIAAVCGVNEKYRKTRDISNGAVMYRRATLPLAKPVYGWDREIQLELTRMGFLWESVPQAKYKDLRPPKTVKPPLTRVIQNRVSKKLAEIIGASKRNDPFKESII